MAFCAVEERQEMHVRSDKRTLGGLIGLALIAAALAAAQAVIWWDAPADNPHEWWKL